MACKKKRAEQRRKRLFNSSGVSVVRWFSSPHLPRQENEHVPRRLFAVQLQRSDERRVDVRGLGLWRVHNLHGMLPALGWGLKLRGVVLEATP